jgi:Ca-activated chloride channel homolog
MARILSWRHTWWYLIFVMICPGISWAADPEKPDFTVHTDANEIRLSFSATDQNDHGVATLQAGDIVVVDRDIVVRRFQSFARSDWTRLEIAILADSSESMTPQFGHEVKEIVDLLSASEGIPEENLSLFSFRNSQPALVCAGNCRASEGADRLPAIQPGGLTPLFDAVVLAADFLARHSDPSPEKILIVFSDGADTISRNTLSAAIETAVRDDVRIYSVDLNHTASSGSIVLYRFSADTGGRYFSERTTVADVLSAILETFRATYSVSYRLPTQVLGFHSIRVLPTHNLHLQFRSRSGYYYPDNSR